jgi:hypothetical protein
MVNPSYKAPTMTGRSRLPGGEPRKASQKLARKGDAEIRIGPRFYRVRLADLSPG